MITYSKASYTPIPQAYQVEEFLSILRPDIQIPDQDMPTYLSITSLLFHGKYDQAQVELESLQQESMTLLLLQTLVQSRLSPEVHSPPRDLQYGQENTPAEMLLMALHTCILLERSAVMMLDDEANEHIRAQIQVLEQLAPREAWFDHIGIGDPVWQCWHSYAIKYLVLFSPPDYPIDTIVQQYHRSVSFFETLENQVEQVMMSRALGNRLYQLGRIDLALDAFQAALEVAQQIELQEECFGLQNNLGVLARQKGNYSQALNHYQRALELTEQFQELERHQGMVLNNLGVTNFYMSDLNRALDYYQKAMRVYEQHGNPKQIASGLDNIGEVHYKQGHYRTAMEYYHEGLVIRRQIGIKRDIATSLDSIGQIFQLTGDLDEALRYYTEAYELRKDLDNDLLLAQSHYNLGMTYQIYGQLEQAEAAFKQLVTLQEERGNLQDQARAYFALIRLYREMDRHAELENYYDKMIVDLPRLLNKQEQEVREVRDLISITRALRYKEQPRKKYRFMALQELQQVQHSVDYDFELSYYISLQILELLIFELNTFYEDQVREEIISLLNHTKQQAKEQNALPKLHQLSIFEAELALLDLDIERAEKILIQHLLSTEQLGLNLLNTQINQFYLEFTEHKEAISHLKGEDIDFSEVLKASTISSTIEKLTKISTDYYLEQPVEEGKIVLIIRLESGMTLYGKSLDDDFVMNKFLIGSVITAINSVMSEAFHTDLGLHRIEHSGNIAIFTQKNNILFCYMYSGETVDAITKLYRFRDEISSNLSLWNSLQQHTTKIEPSIETRLDAYVEKYFLAT